MGVLRRNLVDLWADLDGPQLAYSYVRSHLNGAGLVFTDRVGSGMSDIKRVGLGVSVSQQECSDETWLTYRWT